MTPTKFHMRALIVVGCFFFSSAYIRQPLVGFRSEALQPRNTQLSPLFFNGKSSRVIKKITSPSSNVQNFLKMGNSDAAESDEKNEANEEKKSPVENPGADGSLLKNAFLMVPLIFKFIIVLVVKILTDVVVFPLLFLIRALRLLKNKFVSMLSSPKNGDDGKSDVIDYKI